MPKRKFLLHGTSKIVYQVYHSKEERKKENQSFFPTKKIKSVQTKRVCHIFLPFSSFFMHDGNGSTILCLPRRPPQHQLSRYGRVLEKKIWKIYLEGTQGMGFTDYCISHPFKRRNWCFGRFTEFLLSRLFFCSIIQTFTEMSTEAYQEGMFTWTIAKRPGINTRMC
jgi:hypothetical protein